MAAVIAKKPLRRTVRDGGRKIAKGSWAVPGCSAKAGTDLSFVEHTENGIDWFAVSLPKTEYGHPSHALGKAYAFELIDGLRNPEGDVGPIHMGIVMSALGKWARQCHHVGMSGFLQGFGAVLGEYIQTHNAAR